MTAASHHRPSWIGVLPLAVAAGPVVGIAWAAAGTMAARVAMLGVGVAAAIYYGSELTVSLAGVHRPLERLMLGMLIRGGVALTAITLAVMAGGAEPKVVASVALPLYASLVAGEVLVARRLQRSGEGA